ncbi:aldo/keto reductase [Sphaerisporangium sp. TRM90804]|uniref:aldo/keto reductase n=1 Tax=Sphaerisporangium sp. TRM90804 TaxID=3031113 RepID=UPI00244878EC|nr:aldo/keto reductase [Sphaerisporangium sp. TRM90804]MDH2429628.1 aldo/keto reductase [Sphaerisporangium sp. TRM90804]
MQVKKVGRNGLVSSAIGLGGLALTGAYGRVEPAESFRTVGHALDLGVTLIDLAVPGAGGARGTVERLVGKAVSGRRDEVLITSCGGPARPERSVEASLRRLRTDRIDVYSLHLGGTARVEETVGRMARLVADGKVGSLGLCGPTAGQLRRAHAVHPIALVASEYSLWDRRVEERLLPAARELGVGFSACRPLGRGFLTGRVVSPEQFEPGDHRLADPRFEAGNLAVNRKLLPAAEYVAAQLNLGLGRLALAWLLSRGDDVVAVPSTRSRIHLEMNAAAAGVRLTPELGASLAAAFPAQAVAGGGRRRPP